MRGCMLFVVGLTVGVMAQGLFAQTVTPNRGLIGLNHVAIQVPNSGAGDHVLHEDAWVSGGVPEPQ